MKITLYSDVKPESIQSESREIVFEINILCQARGYLDKLTTGLEAINAVKMSNEFCPSL